MGLRMLGGTGYCESLGHGGRVKPTRTGWREELKEAAWQPCSEAWIQPCRKHPKTFILYLPSKLSLTHVAIISLPPSTPGPLLLAASGYSAALVFL